MHFLLFSTVALPQIAGLHPSPSASTAAMHKTVFNSCAKIRSSVAQILYYTCFSNSKIFGPATTRMLSFNGRQMQ